MTPQLNHYKYIDALRGVAFLCVLTLHAGLQTGFSPGKDFLGKGQYGVQLFFVLSAVTLLRSASLRSQERFAKRSFYIRRLFRIAPLFWFGILLYFVVHRGHPSFSAPDGVRPWHYLATFFFLHGWTPTSINSVVPGGWSIAVEMTFYLLLPFLARRITSIRASLAAALCALVASTVLNTWLAPILARTLPASHRYLIPEFLFWWFPFQLSIFLLGFAIYHSLRNEEVQRFLAIPGRSAMLVIAGLCAVIGLATLNTYPWGSIHVCYAALFGVIILGLSARPTALFVNPVTCGLGIISFSCYLTHFVALTLVKRVVRPEYFVPLPHHLAPVCYFFGVWFAALTTTAILSAITYFAIEKPGIRLGNWIIGRYADELPVAVSQTMGTPGPLATPL